ncbi:hypothetical protein SBBP1_420007 [Burkholderiales bacterium]|nr:hypothetical protein SBBP1_420007 [Burkholderiales bacterium]
MFCPSELVSKCNQGRRKRHERANGSSPAPGRTLPSRYWMIVAPGTTRTRTVEAGPPSAGSMRLRQGLAWGAPRTRKIASAGLWRCHLLVRQGVLHLAKVRREFPYFPCPAVRADLLARTQGGAARHRLRVFTGEEGSAPLDLAHAGSGPASTASSAADQLAPRRRMEGTPQQVHRDHSAQRSRIMRGRAEHIRRTATKNTGI